MKLLRDFWRLILIGIGLLVLLAACGGVKLGQLASETVKPATGDASSLSMSLHTVPTVRSVTVSPKKAKFGNCTGGSTNVGTVSQNKELGFPNGTCWVGSPGDNGVLPVIVTNTGIAANIKVNGADAVPGDGGTSWHALQHRPEPGRRLHQQPRQVARAEPVPAPQLRPGPCRAGQPRPDQLADLRRGLRQHVRLHGHVRAWR